jgi:hypothetical protein
MTTRPDMNGELFEITIGSRLGSRSSRAFEGFELVDVAGDGMILRGLIADQAALHGVLGRIRDLGIALIAVRRIDGHQAVAAVPEPAAPSRTGMGRISDEAE